MINLHIYPSTFQYESRILKETESLIKLKIVSKVMILCVQSEGQARKEFLDKDRTVVRLPNVSWSKQNDTKLIKLVGYIEFYIRAIYFCLRTKIDIINCHSLMVLPIGVLIKRLKRCALIYDTHELETERINLRGIAQRASKWIEKVLYHHVDRTVTVSDSIRKWYTNSYKNDKEVYLIRNIPKARPQIEQSIVLKEKLKIPHDHVLAVYQGLIASGRGIEIYLDAFQKLPQHFHLLVLGYGPMTRKIKATEKQFPNIHYHPPVKHEHILTYTSGCDIGLSIIENVCLSYYFSLPNKLFEYISSGIPVVTSDFPDMSSIVRSHDVGWTIKPSAQDLITCIEGITPQILSEKKKNTNLCKELYTWENEERVLLDVYKDIT